MADFPATPQPLFADAFASDTSAAYTFLRGSTAGITIASGELQPATSSEKVAYPTAVAALADSTALWKFKIGATGRNYHGLVHRATGANDFLVAYLDSDVPGVRMARVDASAFTFITTLTPISFARGTYYWLLSTVKANRWLVRIFDTDPLTSTDLPLGAGVVNLSGTNFASGITGRTAWRINNLDDNLARMDDFRVWAGAPVLTF